MSNERRGEQADYLSYLLRLWRESDGEAPAWRALLKSSQTGEEVGFGSLEELFAFIREQSGGEDPRNRP